MKRTVKILLVAFALTALSAATAAAEPNGPKLFSSGSNISSYTHFAAGSVGSQYMSFTVPVKFARILPGSANLPFWLFW